MVLGSPSSGSSPSSAGVCTTVYCFNRGRKQERKDDESVSVEEEEEDNLNNNEQAERIIEQDTKDIRVREK